MGEVELFNYAYAQRFSVNKDNFMIIDKIRFISLDLCIKYYKRNIFNEPSSREGFGNTSLQEGKVVFIMTNKSSRKAVCSKVIR